MKKVLLLFLLFFFLTGCINVNQSNYEGIIAFALNNETEPFKNKTSQGYSYYLPKGLNILEDNHNNVILKSDKYTLYLYLDLVSYYNKVKENYLENNTTYFSKKITNGDKFGYLEINLKEKNKYLIEIMYNYAKIEVIVKKEDIKVAIANCLSVLTSIKFNDNVLKTLLDEEVSQFKEYEFNIFETGKVKDSEYLQAIEQNVYEEKDDVHDSDLID